MNAAMAKSYTPEDLLRMNGERYELVDGDLVEKGMSFRSDKIGGRIYYRMEQFCETQPIGRANPETSFQCFPDAPNRVRRPDASFISFDRLPADVAETDGHCRIVPDLVAEVVSPNDLYSDVEEKVAEYKSAGVRLIWVVNPPARTVRIHRKDGTVTDVGPTATLSGEDVLPGFTCPVAALFPLPKTAPERDA